MTLLSAHNSEVPPIVGSCRRTLSHAARCLVPNAITPKIRNFRAVGRDAGWPAQSLSRAFAIGHP
jgi:hypothetical protein